MKKNLASVLSSIRQKNSNAGKANSSVPSKAHFPPPSKTVLNKAGPKGPKMPSVPKVGNINPPTHDVGIPEAKVGSGSVKMDQPKMRPEMSKEKVADMKHDFEQASQGKTKKVDAYDKAKTGFKAFIKKSMEKRLKKNANLYTEEKAMNKLNKSEYEPAEAIAILIERYKELSKSYDSKKLHKGCDMLKSFLGKIKERKSK